MVKKARNEKIVFIGRDSQLNSLERATGNLCLIGDKGIGKTTILKEFISRTKGRKAIYIDFEEISLSPEDFCIEFIGNICHGLFGGNPGDYLELSYLEKIKDKLGKGKEIIEKVKNELEKISPDQRLLVELAFDFSEVIGEKIGEKIVLCMDEFWRILDMNNFSKINDIISLIKSSSSAHPYTSYLITGSAVELTKEISKRLDMKIEEIREFDKRDVKELASGIPDKDVELIYRLSEGLPYAVSVLIEKYKGDVKKEFAKDMLDEKGVLHNYLGSYLNESLGRARGKSLLWVILKKLSRREMKLNEVSRAIYRSSAVTKNLLSRLMDVDLVVKEGNVYSVKNRLLRYFIEKRCYGNAEEEI